MRIHLLLLQRLLCMVILIGCLMVSSAIANEGSGPVYQRGRHPTGNMYFGGHRFPGYGWHQGGWNFYSPQIYGNWYQRPYPYHLDYHQLRSRMPIQIPPECPCPSQLEIIPEAPQ